MAEFGQLSHEDGAGLLAYTLDIAEQGPGLFKRRAGGNEAIAGVLDLSQVFFEHFDKSPVLAQTEGIAVMLRPVAFALEGVDEFITAVEQLSELETVLILWSERHWLEIGAKAAQEPGVDGIALCQDAEGLGVTAHAQRLHEADGKAGLQGCAHQGLFIAAAGLADEVQPGRIGTAGKGLEQVANSGGGVGKAMDDIEKIENEFTLGDIDPDMDRAVLMVHNVSC